MRLVFVSLAILFILSTTYYLSLVFGRDFKKKNDKEYRENYLVVPSQTEDYKFSREDPEDDLKYQAGNILKSREKIQNANIPDEASEWPPVKPSHYKPDLSSYTQVSHDEALSALVKYYLAPWTPINGSSTGRITQRMLAAMELSYKGGSVRIRIHQGRIYYRKLVYWKQTYRTQRLAWYLAFLRDCLDNNILQRSLSVDFVLYLGDGPKVAADTFTAEAGFPLFSLRTSGVHLDIPVPDPTAFGSNGNYLWPAEARSIPWEERLDRLVFRGRASCLKMQADNWHFCNRVRAAQLSLENSAALDIGLIEWNQLYGSPKTLQEAPSAQEIESSTNVKLKPALDYCSKQNSNMFWIWTVAWVLLENRAF